MASVASTSSGNMDQRRKDALIAYRNKLRQHEGDAETLKNLRFSLKDLEKDFEKTENDIKAVQSVGQIIGEVLKQLDDERCA